MEIPTQSGDLCIRCGDPLDSAGKVVACRACRLAPPPFERAVAYAPYDGRMRDVIHALKYDRLHPAVRGLAQLLASAIAQLAPDAPAEMLVVPIPLHRAKQADRGFNQAQLLAAQAVNILRKSRPAWQLTLAPSLLIRVRATETQAGLTPRQRRLNMRSAFAVPDPSAVAGKHVLIVDDILTTGATARAAARALIDAGAASAWVATLARARMRSARLGSAVFNDDAADDHTSNSQPQPASMYPTSSSLHQPSS
jgi:ComF family protein